MDDSSNIETIKMLIDAGADVNMVDNDMMSALAYAVVFSNSYYTNMETIKILIDSGSDVDHRSNDGCTYLMYTFRYFTNIRVAKMLIDAGADVNIKNNKGKTCLMILLMNTFFKNFIKHPIAEDNILIMLLHASRETLLDADTSGKTAYDYYVEGGHNILDDYQLKMLKEEIHYNCTKSAKYS